MNSHQNQSQGRPSRRWGNGDLSTRGSFLKVLYRLGTLLPLLLCLWALLVQPTSSSPTLATQVVERESANPSTQLGGGPPALSHTCGNGAVPIDYDQPVCCVNGYVYLNGQPVEGATVTISANGQSVTVETEAGEDEHRRSPGHDEPHFGVSLSEGLLAVEPGQMVTMTAEVDGLSKTHTFIAQPGAEQQDIILPQRGLSKRLDHAMAFDGQDVILFGGLDNHDRLNETSRWDGERWTIVMSPLSPASRDQHAMAYDAVGERIVLFGGQQDSESRFDDTWQWNGTEWQALSPSAGVSPAARSSHAMVYDAAREQIVLFGGYDGTNFLNDTWLWDGERWTDVTPPAGASPSVRANHAMAYDALNQRVVLFGGASEGNHYLAETWSWDGEAWTEANPAAGSSPPARAQHTMAYDALNQQIVLFSGFNGSYLNETWLWNGTTWTERQPQTSPPRRGHAMAYDTNRERIVLFGGDAEGSLADTWEWDGHNWELRANGDEYVLTPPIATINHINPRDARQGSDSITFRGSGSDADATDIIQNYRWTLDGQQISTQAIFTLTAEALYDFSVGTKTISFQVEDDEGTWSAPSQQTIYIRDGHADTGGEGTWTLLIYAVADNDLDHWMGDNANGMLHRLSLAGAEDNVQVGILYDGPIAGDTRRYILQDDGDWIQEAWDEEEARMDEMETLREFIEWGYDTFESDYYALSLVDHANGIVGFGEDRTTNADGSALLTPLELREALRQATNGRKIDVLHYDGCSFGLLENAAIARGLAEYVIASPNTGWGIFAYEQYRELAGRASTPREYARLVAQQYSAEVEVAFGGLAYTISVFDMQQFEEVNRAVSTLGNRLLTYVLEKPSERREQVLAIRNNSQKYDSGGEITIEIDNEDSYVDLVDFVSKLQEQLDDQDVINAAETVEDAIKETFVIYEKHQSGPFYYDHTDTTYDANLSEAYGLGIFYPARSSGSAYDNYVENRLFDTTADSEWTDFLQQGIPDTSDGDPPGLDDLIPPLIPKKEFHLFLPSVQR